MFNFLKHYKLWEQSLIIGSILMVIIIFFGILIPLIKPKIKRRSMVYLYSFSTGYFIVLAIFGLLRDSLNHLTTSVNTDSKALSNFIIILVMVSGIGIGMCGGLFFRYILSKKSPELHINHANHSHSDHVFNISDIDNPKGKWVAILLLLSHRLIAGLTLGLLVYNFHNTPINNDVFNFGLIIAFILHLIPEVLIIYYRQREAGVKKWTAIFNGLVFKFMMIILILAGAYIGKFISVIFWMIPLFLAISAGAMSFAAIFELTPEILDNKDYLNKNWYKISFTLISSFMVAIALLTLGA